MSNTHRAVPGNQHSGKVSSLFLTITHPPIRTFFSLSSGNMAFPRGLNRHYDDLSSWRKSKEEILSSRACVRILSHGTANLTHRRAICGIHV